LRDTHANLNVLGPETVRLTFGDQSLTNDDVRVTVSNLTNRDFGAIAPDSEVIFLDPNSLDIIGYSGMAYAKDRPYQDLSAGMAVSIHFIGDPRDCRSTRSRRLSDGTYPAYIRVDAQGPVGIYLIPAIARVTNGWATMAPPAERARRWTGFPCAPTRQVSATSRNMVRVAE
jgi:hypothetical protein